MDLKNVGSAQLVNPLDHGKKEQYTNLMVELRTHKGLTYEVALGLIEDPLYLATLMIKSGDADGEVAGAMNATGDVLRPAFQFFKTLPGISVVSVAFLMINAMLRLWWSTFGYGVFLWLRRVLWTCAKVVTCWIYLDTTTLAIDGQIVSGVLGMNVADHVITIQ